MAEWVLERAKTGEWVPLVRTPGGNKPLHSLFDPMKEARRQRDLQRITETWLVWGLGGGFHLRCLLEDPRVKKILLVEPDETLVNLWAGEDFIQEIFQDPRVRMWKKQEPLEDWLAQNYQPLWDGDLETWDLKPRTQLDSSTFQGLSQQVQQGISRIQGDLSTQAKFGQLWMRNFLKNILQNPQPPEAPTRTRRFLILGAGPSLEDQEAEIRRLQPCYTLATDTALPWALQRGIPVDLGMSLDPQIISYHHFVPDFPKPPVVLDLMSPPGITRHIRGTFFSSGHPLALWMNSFTGRFPQLDTSGGNVAWTAAVMAEAWGAQEIFLAGCDFSYPQGKTYARGTYVYPFFDKVTHRSRPLETWNLEFSFRAPEIHREETPQGLRYTTPMLKTYRDFWSRRMKDFQARITFLPGRGLPVIPLEESRAPGEQVYRRFPPGGSLTQWLKIFDHTIRQKTAYNEGGPLTWALAPLAAWVKSKHPEIESPQELWETTQSQALNLWEGVYEDF